MKGQTIFVKSSVNRVKNGGKIFDESGVVGEFTCKLTE